MSSITCSAAPAEWNCSRAAKTKDGKDVFAINVRCLDGVDIAKLEPKPVDGRSL